MEHFSDALLVKKINKIISVLEEKLVVSSQKIKNVTYIESGYTKDNLPPEEAEWKQMEDDTEFVCHDRHYWFHFSLKTPELSPEEAVYLSFQTGREGQWDAVNPQMLLFLNGEIVQGVDTNHTEVKVAPNTDYEAYGYFYAGLSGDTVRFIPRMIIKNTEVEALYYDIKVPFEAAKLYDVDSLTHITIMRALDNAVRKLDMRDLAAPAFYQSVQAASAYLADSFYNGVCGKDDSVTITCIGHTHIDVAWRWQLAQTVEKAQRSFATVLKLMEEYPEYKFMSSQPQLYQYVKEHAPAVYEKMKQRIAEGRFEPEGGMWLEADCNITGGESLVRQLLLGKRFMKEEFGVDSKIVWLPDVFGYSAALPQIMKKSGIETFVTSKISWNDTNRMPYDAFMWEGIDGTEIFTYFITAQDAKSVNSQPENYSTYNGFITPSMVLGTWKRFEHKGYSSEACITYGYGDGGGGPTREMLEYQRRLSFGLPGIPKTKTDTAGAFLDRVKKSFDQNAEETGRTPRWCGELYLEFHRGTYTTMAANKNYNRRSEFLYRQTEALAATAMKLTGASYPGKEIYNAWEIICLNQFHDIIPGSSIREVYEDSKQQYETILSTAKTLSSTAMDALCANINSTKSGVLVYNPHSFAFSGTVDLGGKQQTVHNIPPFGWKVVAAKEESCTVSVTENSISNQYYTITFESGDIISFVDKRAGRELVKAGCKLNRFNFHEDFPFCYDAWEISKYYEDKTYGADEVLSPEIVCEGARAGLKFTKRFGKSTICQTIFLYNEDERIDFVTSADWNEDHMMLKAEFPFDLHANEATYEIQYGSVKRPTHTNTSWDDARFEVCAQKWMDVSEENYGVSILNDCKYGYGANGSDITITLLRSPTEPNPVADKGHHEFTYSLLPHNCSLSESHTVQESYKLNAKPVCREITAQSGSLPEEFSLVSVNSENVIIETVKKAEDDDGIIIRLYEHGNRRETVCLTFGFPAAEAFVCDLMETEQGTLAVADNTVSFEVKPFEIVTLKIK